MCRPIASSVFDPATLTLTGWWRASYAGSPWAGTASAGSSGSRNLTEGTNPPATGSALNGLTPADCDGSNDQLSNALATNNFITTAAYSVAVLFNADTADADAGASTFYTNRGLVFASGGTNGGIWGVTHTTSGVRAGHWNGATWNSAIKAASTAAWHLTIVTYDGTNISVWVDDVTNSGAVSVAHGNVDAGSIASDVLRIGTQYNQAAFFDGKITEVMLAQVAWSETDRTNIKSYINSRYALSL